MSQHPFKLRYIFFFLLLLGLGTGAGGLQWFFHEIDKPGRFTEIHLVYIPPGSSAAAIAKKLEENHIIENRMLFRWAARLAGRQNPLKAGEYEIADASSIRQIIALLQSGKTYQRQITIAEGLMSFEIVEILNRAQGLEGVSETIPAEGSLLPETYNYSYGDRRDQIITRMQGAMTKTIAELWQARAENLPIQTPEEAVILASIVEKETGVAAERPRVAGVFINRLRTGMPLQSDPTTIYALTLGKSRLDRPLLRKDLEIQSPYNTYTVSGLPPTPIANPGRASIAAVLQPETHDYIYFVADGTGGHAFAKTLDAHNQNVAHWRKVQKNQ